LVSIGQSHIQNVLDCTETLDVRKRDLDELAGAEYGSHDLEINAQ
jgi:hypothetical protein